MTLQCPGVGGRGRSPLIFNYTVIYSIIYIYIYKDLIYLETLSCCGIAGLTGARIPGVTGPAWMTIKIRDWLPYAAKLEGSGAKS